MTELEKAYKEGYEACKRDLAKDPNALFSLLPSMAESLKSNMEQIKGQVPKEYQEMISKAMSGEVSHSELLAFINEQKAK